MRSRTLSLVAAATSAVAALAFAGGTTAQAATPATTSKAPAAAAPAATQFHIAAQPLDSKAITASMAAHHGILTLAEAKRLGIRPDTIYKNTPQIRALASGLQEHASTTSPGAAARSPHMVRPMSASGCNDLVCIEVTGSGLEVTKWFSAAYSVDTEDICSYPIFWVDDEPDIVGDEVCGTLLQAWDDEPEWFEDNTQLCNSWPGVAGMPCETVHD
jgi:hypothetical protein